MYTGGVAGRRVGKDSRERLEAYRTVLTVQLGRKIYVLHAFQKIIVVMQTTVG